MCQVTFFLMILLVALTFYYIYVDKQQPRGRLSSHQISEVERTIQNIGESIVDQPLLLRHLSRNYYLSQIERIYILCLQVSAENYILITANTDLDAVLDCCEFVGATITEEWESARNQKQIHASQLLIAPYGLEKNRIQL